MKTQIWEVEKEQLDKDGHIEEYVNFYRNEFKEMWASGSHMGTMLLENNVKSYKEFERIVNKFMNGFYTSND